MNEFSHLKQVILGDDFLNITRPQNINDFKHFYNTKNFIEFDKKKLIERISDIKNIKKRFLDLGIDVVQNRFRPGDKIDFIISSNVRDILLFLDDDYVLICEPYISFRKKEFLNYNIPKKFKRIYLEKEFKKYKHLKKDKYIYDIRKVQVDYFEKKYHEYYPLIEAANFLKVENNNIVVNISNHSEFHAYILISKMLPNYNFIPTFIDKNHIDGALVQINDKIYLGSSIFETVKDFKKKLNIDYFEKKDIIYFPKTEKPNNKLASVEGMDINVLMLNESTCMIRKTDNKCLYDELKKRKINLEVVRLRHCEYFGGGVHCITSDVKREY